MRHQLVGFDLGWAETGSDRSVSYVRLPAGKYTLRAIACNQDGAWNETGDALALVVVPALVAKRVVSRCAAVRFCRCRRLGGAILVAPAPEAAPATAGT